MQHVPSEDGNDVRCACDACDRTMASISITCICDMTPNRMRDAVCVEFKAYHMPTFEQREQQHMHGSGMCHVCSTMACVGDVHSASHSHTHNRVHDACVHHVWCWPRVYSVDIAASIFAPSIPATWSVQRDASHTAHTHTHTHNAHTYTYTYTHTHTQYTHTTRMTHAQRHVIHTCTHV